MEQHGKDPEPGGNQRIVSRDAEMPDPIRDELRAEEMRGRLLGSVDDVNPSDIPDVIAEICNKDGLHFPAAMKFR
jgi:hypothetical protein